MGPELWLALMDQFCISSRSTSALIRTGPDTDHKRVVCMAWNSDPLGSLTVMVKCQANERLTELLEVFQQTALLGTTCQVLDLCVRDADVLMIDGGSAVDWDDGSVGVRTSSRT